MKLTRLKKPNNQIIKQLTSLWRFLKLNEVNKNSPKGDRSNNYWGMEMLWLVLMNASWAESSREAAFVSSCCHWQWWVFPVLEVTPHAVGNPCAYPCRIQVSTGSLGWPWVYLGAVSKVSDICSFLFPQWIHFCASFPPYLPQLLGAIHHCGALLEAEPYAVSVCQMCADARVHITQETFSNNCQMIH